MLASTPHAVATFVRQLASRQAGGDVPDEELLQRFTTTGDTTAFELLLWRHQRLVMGVCQRILRDVHDAEEAFQATFLVLAQKARSIGTRRALSTWLYTVAYRIALNALKARQRRRARVHPLRNDWDFAVPEQPAGAGLDQLLDEAIHRLPEKYRSPILLCYFEGRSQVEAARILGCASGTIASRLARAKIKLRAWFEQRGIRVTSYAVAGALGSLGSSAASARAAISATLDAVTILSSGGPWEGTVSPQVVGLAQGAVTSALRTRLLQALVLVLGPSMVWAASHAFLGQPSPAKPPAASSMVDRMESVTPNARHVDVLGDPLPGGAVARLGSLRFYHGEQVHGVIVSPDGKWIVSRAFNGGARLWDARTGKERALTRDLKQAVFTATNEKLVAVKRPQPGCAVLWDVEADKQIARITMGGGNWIPLALSPDGKTLVWESLEFGRTGPRRQLLFSSSANASRYAADIQPVRDGVWEVVFAANSNVVAIHYGDNRIEVWDLKNHTVILSPKLKNRWLGHLGLSPDGKMLATEVIDEKQIQLWDVRARQELKPLVITTGRARGPSCFSPDGKLLAVSYEGELGLWDVATRKEICRLQGKEGALNCLTFSRDGKRLIAGDGNGISIWDLATRQRLHDYGHTYAIWSVAFSPDGRTIATGAIYTDHIIRIWDAHTGRLKARWPGPAGGVIALDYSPDGALLATGTDDGSVRLWDAATGKACGCLDAHDGRWNTLAFSPDGRLLASGGKRKAVHLWDLATRKEIRSITNPGDRTVRLAFSPDGKTLVSRSLGDNSVRFWYMATGAALRNLRDLKAGCASFSFSPDGRTLAVNCDDGTIRVLDVASGRTMRTLPRPASSEAHNRCLGVVFAPDGRSLAAGYDDRTVRLWELVSGRQRACFTGHAGVPLGLAYSPDGSLLVSGSSDHTGLVWDVLGHYTGHPDSQPLAPAQLDHLWSALADQDASLAYRAMQSLLAHRAQAVALLKERLHPATATSQAKVARLVADLDSKRFAIRENATRQLSELGAAAEPALQAAMRQNPSLELRRRVEGLLERMRASPPASVLRGVRGIEVLEHLATPEAQQEVQTLATGVAEAQLTHEARAALQRRKKR